MDYPSYVPAAVQTQISELIGDSTSGFGLASSLASSKEQVAKIDRSIKERTHGSEVDKASLRRQRAEAVKHRELVAADLSFLRRLALDKRMLDAYSILAPEFSTNQQWHDFIYDAWAARLPFEPHREAFKRTLKLGNEIAKTSEKLAQLLREANSIGASLCPSEFFSIRELLLKTNNAEKDGNNWESWRALRGDLAGSGSPGRIRGSEQEQPGEKIDSVREAPLFLGYAWTVAHPFSALIDTLAKVARDFIPRDSGMIGAAIKTRQANKKTAYLRAFAYLLTEENHIPLTITVMKAMAIVTTVAINDRDVDASYDDVRKVLATLRVEPLKNSGEEEPTANYTDFRPG